MSMYSVHVVIILLPAFPLCRTNIYSILYYVVLPILSTLNKLSKFISALELEFKF